ncbi:MAG: metallophosphatase family protein [Gemmataceae bacterium]|nr:metallophosphatase family protein [Gemmataceae bacterium]
MRILLVADIHGNRPALEAIREPYDVALFLGDAVEYGVEPAPCIDWVRKRCAYSVRGNHDHGTAHDVPRPPVTQHGFKYLTGPTRALTRERISEADRRTLAGWPLTQFLTLDGVRIMMVHATPRDPLDEYAPPDVNFWARRLEGIDVDVICVGHTHRPYALEVGKTLVINPGSVGLQREGDPRGSYAVLSGRDYELKRFEYPVAEAVAAVEAAPLADEVKHLLTGAYRDGQLPNGKASPGPSKP